MVASLVIVLLPVACTSATGADTTAESAMPWEGSPEQKAFSEFNHRVSGLGLLIIGGLFLLTEHSLIAHRWLACWPLILLGLGIYLLIWSDRFAWPIGPQGFVDTLFDAEAVQHKTYAFLLLALSTVEWVRWQGGLAYAGPLIFLGLVCVAGLLLFLHSPVMATHHHAPHLLFNHVLMGIIALVAAAARTAWDADMVPWRHGWLLWPVTVWMLGLLLVFYSE